MATKTAIVRNFDFEMLAEGVKPDAKNRVNLRSIKVLEGVTYHVYRNRLGQIVLDPQVSIPAAEAWLFKDPEALASVRRGLSQAKRAKVSRVNLEEL